MTISCLPTKTWMVWRKPDRQERGTGHIPVATPPRGVEPHERKTQRGWSSADFKHIKSLQNAYSSHACKIPQQRRVMCAPDFADIFLVTKQLLFLLLLIRWRLIQLVLERSLWPAFACPAGSRIDARFFLQ